MIRMLKRIIGEDAFNRGMQLYFERRDGTASTVEDFIGFEEARTRTSRPSCAGTSKPARRR